MSCKKFTFKTVKETGRLSFAWPDQHYIKYNKKEVGSIEDKEPFTIRLKVYKTETINDNNPNCNWMWIKLKKQSISLLDAKEFLNSNFEKITAAYKIVAE